MEGLKNFRGMQYRYKKAEAEGCEFNGKEHEWGNTDGKMIAKCALRTPDNDGQPSAVLRFRRRL